jgi:hypothetical protein
MEQEMAIIIANGGRFHAWDAPTPGSGLTAERMEFAGKVVAPFLRARQAWCLGSTRVPMVSLLFTSTHFYTETRESPVCFPNGGRVSRSLRGASDALWQAHLDYEVVSRERLLAQDIKTTCLVAENLAAIKSDEVAALRIWVEKGGKLVLTGAALKEPALAELAGVRVPQNAVMETVAFQIEIETKRIELNLSLLPVELPADAKAERMLAAQCARGTQPLIWLRKAGDGVVLSCAAPLFSLPKPGEPILASQRLLQRWLLDVAVPANQRRFTTSAPATVETVLRRKDRAWVLHLVNRAEGARKRFPSKHPQWEITAIPPVPECRMSLVLPEKPAVVMLQPQGLELQGWGYERGRLELVVPGFSMHQMVVIR